MKILVTGGAGFVGSNLANELSKNNEVFVLDNLYTGKKENLNRKIKLIKGDDTDYGAVEKTIRGMDYVFHFAALTSGEYSLKNPKEVFNVNTFGTYNVLKASLKNKVKKVIYASTAGVYGDSPELTKKETMKPEPKTPYAFSKLNSEYLCSAFSKLGLKTIYLRFFNIYGPNQNLNSDYSAVIPIFINNALKNKPLKLENQGKQTRDFIFVKDVVDACTLAIKKGHGVYNVCSGKEITVKELAENIKKLVKSSSRMINAPERKNDIEKSLGSYSKINKLGWKPNTNIEQGLRKTINWCKNNKF